MDIRQRGREQTLSDRAALSRRPQLLLRPKQAGSSDWSDAFAHHMTTDAINDALEFVNTPFWMAPV